MKKILLLLVLGLVVGSLLLGRSTVHCIMRANENLRRLRDYICTSENKEIRKDIFLGIMVPQSIGINIFKENLTDCVLDKDLTEEVEKAYRRYMWDYCINPPELYLF